MSVSGPEAANYATDIDTDLNDQRVRDHFDSSDGFDEPIAEVTNDYSESLSEMDRTPEAIHTVFLDMDADEKLIRDAIRQRQGVRRAYSTARDAWRNTPGPQNTPVPSGAVPGAPGAPTPYPAAPVAPPAFPGMPVVPPLAGPGFMNRLRQIGAVAGQAGAVAGHGLERAGHVVRNLSREGFGFYGAYDAVKENWVAKVVMSAGTSALARTAFHAMGVAGGPLGTMVGVTTGGIWGYIRGKNQTESAATWMADLDILKMDADHLNQFDEAQLERTVGIIKNAVDDGRMRGGPEQKLELAAKYRIMKNRLIHLRNEANNRGDELNPVIKRINESLTSENEIAEQVSRMAGRRYETEFKEIMHLKRNKVLMSAIKGAVVAGTVGGIFGFVQEHGGFHGAVDWIREKIHGIGHDFTGGGHEISGNVQQALEAKQQLLEHSSSIKQEVLEHGNRLDDILKEGSKLNDHYSHIQSLSQAGQDASIEGFKHNFPGDLHSFDGLLHNGNLKDMIQMTNVHNLDLNMLLPNGEHFGQYLVENKETFLQFSPDLQSFILSHPSVAPDFMNIVSAGSEETLKAIIDRYSVVLGAAALGGAVGLFVRAHRGQKESDKAVQEANYDGFQAVTTEMRSEGSNSASRGRDERNAQRNTQRTAEQEREAQIEVNRVAAINELTNAELVVFIDPADPRYNDLNRVNFHVDGVNRDGNNVATTLILRPITPLPRGRNIYNIDVNEYIDMEGNLRRDRVRLRTQADRQREQEAQQNEYERFINQTILGRFVGGVFVPDQAAAAALNLPQNMINGVRVEGHTTWPTGLDVSVRLTDLHRPVLQDPIYTVSAECQVSLLGNYLYKEGYQNTPNPAKNRHIQQVVRAGSLPGVGATHLLYMSGHFYSIESLHGANINLQQYDLNGNMTSLATTTANNLYNSEIYIFDHI